MPLAPGTWLNHYQILGHLGTGGMGEVYRALDNKLQREVALKVLPKAFAQDPERLARFRREAQVLAQLNHVNIAAIYNLEQSGETHFLVMELALGDTLRDRIQRGSAAPKGRQSVAHGASRGIAAVVEASPVGATDSGPVSLEEALDICKQIAAGLECAHEKPIVHRDLKPANIKVSPDGVVKILDFGLARAFSGDSGSGGNPPGPDSPTLSAMTAPGTILGTAAYMSPEQARGKKVDKRTDIWALGCVLYELLTGQQAFDPSRDRERAGHPSPDPRQAGAGRKGGVASPAEPPLAGARGSETNTIADIIGAVLYKEPDWTALPATTPHWVRVLLRRCLEKDAKRRLSSAADLQIQIEEALNAPATAAPTVGLPVPARPLWRRALPWGVAAILSVVTGLAVWTLKPTPPPEPKPVSRVAVNLAPNERLPANLSQPVVALSPDGTQLAYAASRGATQQIYLRAMDSQEARPLAGTEGGTNPFFSPDGQWLGFVAGGQLKKVSISGGAALTLAPAPNLRGASWGDNDMIVLAPTGGGPLSQVPAAGGTPQPLTKFDPATGESTHRWPQLLPGGKVVLFAAGPGGSSPDNAQIVVQNLETGERKALVQGGTYPRYAPTGHLVYYRAGTLMAVSFDLERLEVTGSPSPIQEGIMAATGTTWGAHFSISDRGSLVYVPGTAGGGGSTLVWVDRKGAEQPLAAPPRPYDNPRLSSDGRVLAVGTLTPAEIWVYEIARGTLSRLTFEGGQRPLWSPDGKRIAFRSARAGKPPNLFWKPADGSGAEERLTTSDHLQTALSWSPDGQVLAFLDIAPTTGNDIWVLPLEGDPSAALRTGPSAGSSRLSSGQAGQGLKPRPFLQTTFLEDGAQFSPDGRWLAYVSDESGRSEIYVQPFPGPGGKWQISTEGGIEPMWARNGEIFYRHGNQWMVVETRTQPGSQPIFSAGTPRLLFEGPYVASGFAAANYDVTGDGQRLLMVKPVAQQGTAANQINVVLNWFEELKRRVPSGQ
jgi:serine/threonine-protein kinase